MVAETTFTEAERSALLLQDPSWTEKDYLLIVFAVMIYFGDGVEMYLPGVITQVVSCELGVSSLQEGWLGIIQYATIALTVLFAGVLANFGKRRIIVCSLYCSILFAVLSAVVHNYYTLLLSRALIGVCVGLNICLASLFLVDHVSSHAVYSLGTSLGSVAVAVGAGWSSILGYVVLGAMGWRVLLVIASIPVFIPPLVLLHCFIDTSADRYRDREEEKVEIFVRDPKIRVLKTSLMGFNLGVVGFGSIMLLPTLLRAGNEQVNPLTAGDKCGNAVQGSQLLILAAVHGGANLVGRLIGALLHGRIKFRVLQPILGLVSLVCYGILLVPQGILVTAVVMGVSKLAYSSMMIEFMLMVVDPVYSGSANLDKTASAKHASFYTGAVVGCALAEFISPRYAVICTFVVSILQIGVVCSIDRDT